MLQELLEKRYYLRNKVTGELVEHTPEEMFRRVANYVAQAEKPEVREYWANKFFEIMNDKLFMPNSPTLMNAGKDKCLSACSVIGRIPDSLEGIYEYIWYNAKLTKYGCGVGQDLSAIRPKGEIIKSSGGKSAGVVNWMQLIQAVAETTIQGDSARRSANMVSLRFNHPDIIDFINSKKGNNKFTAMNISVVITDEEFNKALNREEIWLEWNGKKYKKINAGEILDNIIENAWIDGEPGLIFIDKINQYNPFNIDGNLSENDDHYIKTTNPCFAGNMRLLTSEGYKTFEELDGKEVEIVNADGFVTKGKVWCTGEKETIKLILSDNREIICTPDHVFKTIDGKEVKAKDLKGLKLMPAISTGQQFNETFVKYGFIQGDGNLTRLNSSRHHGIEINIGEKDEDILELFKSDVYTKSDRKIYLKGYNEELLKLGFDPSVLYNRKFPATYDLWDIDKKKSFLRGCYSANGSVIKGVRVSYKTASIDFATKLVQTLQEDFGISAYITINKPNKITFSNGTYLCKQSYNIEISKYHSIYLFALNIGFVQKYKQESLRQLIIDRAPYVRKIVNNGLIKVYDFSEPITHWGIVEGVVVHNCGEQPLEDFELCNLGSINLERMYDPYSNSVDLGLLDKTIYTAMRFLDDVIDVNEYVLPQFKEKVLGNRKIGLGVTGFANLLIKLGIRYDSEECLNFIDKLFGFIKQRAEYYNTELAKEKGNFPNWSESIFAKLNMPRRNATITTQAPTGSISTILETEAYGIEPLFSVAYIRRIIGNEYKEVNKLFEEYLKEYIKDENQMQKIIDECIKQGTCQIDEVPEKIRNLFRCANDISPEWHIKVLSRIQKYIDNAVSKTINLPETATKEDVKKAMVMAFELGCKGITVYRNNSRQGQTIQIGTKSQKESKIKLDTIEPIKRSTFGKTYGVTIDKRSACGKMYITINCDKEGNLVETFINVGKNGICQSNINGLNRMVSLALRSGVKVEEIIDQLKGINCPACVRAKTKGEKIDGTSCPDILARVLEAEYNNRENEIIYVKNNDEMKEVNNFVVCPTCGNKMQLQEGCITCLNCGYSKCS